jgi:IS4 transposase
MTRVMVYQYMVLDPERIEKRKSRRWGTREGIESLKDFAEILEFSTAEIDASAVDSMGFTQLDFDPSSG